MAVMFAKATGWSGAELADGSRELKCAEENPSGRTDPAGSDGPCLGHAPQQSRAAAPLLPSGLRHGPVTAAGARALRLWRGRRNYRQAGVSCDSAAVASLGVCSARPHAVPLPARRFVLPAETPALPPDAGGFGRDGPSTQGWGPCWEQPLGAAVASRGSFLRFPRWSLLERDGPSTSVSAVLGPRGAWALGRLGALGVLPSSSGPSGGGTGGVSEAFSDPAGWWEPCEAGALGRPFLGGATER